MAFEKEDIDVYLSYCHSAVVRSNSRVDGSSSCLLLVSPKT